MSSEPAREGPEPEAKPVDGLQVALLALGRKERTEAEMRELLAERGVDSEQIERVVDELLATGGLDDAEFARRYTEDKRLLSNWGSGRIRRVLRDRGIAGNLIEAALAGGEDSELERAVAALGSRSFDLSQERERAKALGFLSRRGFEAEIAYAAIRRLEQT